MSCSPFLSPSEEDQDVPLWQIAVDVHTWGSGVVGSVIDKSWPFKNLPSETVERMMESFIQETQSEASLVFFIYHLVMTNIAMENHHF